MALLEIREREVKGVLIFELSGALVFDDGTRMLRDVVRAAVAGGARACLLDMEGITYLDSGGVGTMVEVYRHVTRRGGQVKLLRPSACARRVLGITRLTAVFDIFDDEADAVRNLAPVAAPTPPGSGL